MRIRILVGVSVIFLLCAFGDADMSLDVSGLLNNGTDTGLDDSFLPALAPNGTTTEVSEPVTTTSTKTPTTTSTKPPTTSKAKPTPKQTSRTSRKQTRLTSTSLAPIDIEKVSTTEATSTDASSEDISVLAIVLIVVGSVAASVVLLIAVFFCWKKRKLCFKGKLTENLSLSQAPMKNMFYKEGQFEQMGPLKIKKMLTEPEPHVLLTPDIDPPDDDKHFIWDEPGNKVFETGPVVEEVIVN
uniref:DAG1 domain-containing protein n=1 Tax=Steinernema glaseri TaxID=37863 RepID=A0A1I7YBT4_9BILA